MLTQILKLILVVYWITNLAIGVTLSGNGTSGGFTVQENSSLQLMCFTSTDVNYVTYYVRLLSLTPMTITSVGYGQSGCGTDPAPPSYLSCSCVSRREYACVIRTVTRNMNEDVWYCLPPGGDLSDESGDQTIVVTIGITAVSMIFPAGSSVSVINNTARQFRCETSAGNPQATVEWYKDSGTPDRADDTHITTGTEIDTSASDTLIVTIGKLTLTVQKNDQEVGVYCKANNGGDWLYSSSVVLDIQYVPSTPKVSYKGSEVTSPVRLISGRSMALICSSIGNPSPTYTWTYPGGGSHSGSTITLAIVLKTHAGGVTCTAMNTLSPTGGAAVVMTRTTTISLQVLYPPSRPSCTTIGTSISTSAVLVEGTDSTFSCISYANPPLITYTWSTPGRGQVSGANVTLTKVHHHADQGQYTLTATNTMDPTSGNVETGTSNTSFSVDIQFEISTPIVSYRGFAITSRVRVISGRSMTLNCSSTGNPSPAYAWTYPGGGSHVGPNLIFTSVQTTLAGNVTCTTWNTLSPTGEIAFVKTKQTTTSLQVLYPPVTPSCTINATIISTTAVLLNGTDGTIICTSSAMPTPTTYTWSTQGRGAVSGANLSLTNVQHPADQGQYTLTVINTMDPNGENTETGTNTTAFWVDVQFGPKVQVPHTYNILEGAALSYPCLFIPGNPSKTSIVWTSSFDHRQWNSQIVSISSVQRSDDGMYTCTATNKMTPTGSPVQIGIHSGTTHINVQYESLVSYFYVTEHIGTVNVTKSEHSDATFTCTVDSNPLSTLNIRKESKTRKSVENSKQLEYTIVNLTCLDAGLYTCDGSNMFNNNTPSTKDLRLFVTCAPRRPPGGNIKTNFTARLHDNATLQYTVLAYPVPSPSQFVWKRCSSSTKCINLSNTSRKTEITRIGLSSSLTIFDISMDDFGVYTISIDNGIGEELVEEIFLRPVGPPDSPRGFKVIPNTITSSSVVLTWIPGFNNGHLQTFHISYRLSKPFADWLEMNVTYTGEPEMNVTLDNLEPGESYIVELYALDLEGASVRRNITFSTLTHTPSGISHLKTQTSTIAGGVAAGIVSILGISVVIFVLRRKYSVYCAFKLTRKEDSPSSQTGHGTGNPGYNVAVTYEEVSMTNNKTVYDALDIGNDRSKASHVYTSLDDSKSNAYYENVKPEDPIYNNTSLTNPAQTVL